MFCCFDSTSNNVGVNFVRFARRFAIRCCSSGSAIFRFRKLAWNYGMNDVALVSWKHSCLASDSVIIIAMFFWGGACQVFGANILLGSIEVQIRTVGCTDTFRCGVLAGGPGKPTLWHPSDVGVLAPIVAAMVASQVMRYTSTASPLRISNCCMPESTLFCVSCPGLPCFSVSARAALKFYCRGPDLLSLKSVDIQVIDIFIFWISAAYVCQCNFCKHTAEFSSLQYKLFIADL